MEPEHRRITNHWRSEWSAGARAAPGGKRAKIVVKIHAKIQVVISYVFACNKNKALQLQRVPILSIPGYNIGSLALRFPKPKTKGRQI